MTFFFLEIYLAAGYITETVAQRSGDRQIEKRHADLGMIANMQCAPKSPRVWHPCSRDPSITSHKLSIGLRPMSFHAMFKL